MKNNNRPVSAIVRRPDSANKFGRHAPFSKKYIYFYFILRPSHSEFPLVNLDFAVGVNPCKARPMTTNMDKEKLYEENMQLKNLLNKIKKDFAFSKSEVHKLEIELNKKEKIIEEIAIDSRGDDNLQGDKMSKIKEVHLY